MVGAVGASPRTALLSENDKAGKVKVAVTAGRRRRSRSPTRRRAATIKVCKWSSSPALQGKQYSFTVGTTTVTATAGSQQGDRRLQRRRDDAARLEAEDHRGRAGQRDGRRDVATGGSATITQPAGGVVKVTAGAGANIVYFDNEPVGPPQTGYLEVCKDAGDQFISATGRRSRSRSPTGRPHRHREGPRRSVHRPDQGRGRQRQRRRDAERHDTYVSDIWTIPAERARAAQPDQRHRHGGRAGHRGRSGDVQLHFENSTLTGDAEGLQVPDRLERRARRADVQLHRHRRRRARSTRPRSSRTRARTAPARTSPTMRAVNPVGVTASVSTVTVVEAADAVRRRQRRTRRVPARRR